MPNARVNGFSLAYTAAGAVVLWSGIRGWTLSQTARSLLGGGTPAASSEPINTSTGEGGLPSAGGGLTGDAGTGSAAYTGTALQALWTANGGAQNTAAIAAAIAGAESGGNAAVTSANPDGGTNVGIFQLDTRGVGAGYSVAQLQNPNLNTRITVLATGNGRNWSSWGDPVANALPGHQYTPGAPVPVG